MEIAEDPAAISPPNARPESGVLTTKT